MHQPSLCYSALFSPLLPFVHRLRPPNDPSPPPPIRPTSPSSRFCHPLVSFLFLDTQVWCLQVALATANYQWMLLRAHLLRRHLFHSARGYTTRIPANRIMYVRVYNAFRNADVISPKLHYVMHASNEYFHSSFAFQFRICFSLSRFRNYAPPNKRNF